MESNATDKPVPREIAALLSDERLILSDATRRDPFGGIAVFISFLDKVSMLRTMKFDQGIVLPHSFRAALLLFLGSVQERIGYRRNSRGFMLTRPLKKPHELVATGEEYLRILDALGAERSFDAPRLRVTEDEEQRFDQRYTNVGTDYVVLIVGAQ